jgi:hypothetical protein
MVELGHFSFIATNSSVEYRTNEMVRLIGRICYRLLIGFARCQAFRQRRKAHPSAQSL